jgi:hypothetical protein
VQEHFGYWVDPEDPRFKLIMEEKEEDLKKAMRKTRKAEKKKLEGLVAKPSPPPVSAQPKSADEPAAADYEDE